MGKRGCLHAAALPSGRAGQRADGAWVERDGVQFEHDERSIWLRYREPDLRQSERMVQGNLTQPVCSTA